MVSMVRREQNLVEQIERDALDEGVRVAATLRKCIALGGRSGSEQLRDWATRELKGYQGEEEVELPPYRVIVAPLLIDGIAGNYKVTRQQFAPSALPDFARDHLSNDLPLRDGVGQLEALSRQSEIKLMPPMGTDLVRLMNQENEPPFQHIEASIGASRRPQCMGCWIRSAPR